MVSMSITMTNVCVIVMKSNAIIISHQYHLLFENISNMKIILKANEKLFNNV